MQQAFNIDTITLSKKSPSTMSQPQTSMSGNLCKHQMTENNANYKYFYYLGIVVQNLFSFKLDIRMKCLSSNHFVKLGNKGRYRKQDFKYGH